MVLFLNDFLNMADFTRKLNGVITNLESKLKAWRPNDATVNRRSKYAAKITLEGALEDGSDLEIDILPSYDNLGRSSHSGMFCIYSPIIIAEAYIPEYVYLCFKSSILYTQINIG